MAAAWASFTRAEDTKLGRMVALKFLPDDVSTDTIALDRFLREARAAAALSHPNICTIFEIGEFQGRSYIAMELLKGATLKAIASRKARCRSTRCSILVSRPPMRSTPRITRTSSIATSSPRIFFSPTAARPRFSISVSRKIVASTVPTGNSVTGGASASPTLEDINLTSPGIAVGTVAYMSPEQTLGKTSTRARIFFRSAW